MKSYKVVEKLVDIKPIGYDGYNFKYLESEILKNEGTVKRVVESFSTKEEAVKFAEKFPKNLKPSYIKGWTKCDNVFRIEYQVVELNGELIAGPFFDYEFIITESGEKLDPIEWENMVDDDILCEIKEENPFEYWQFYYDEYQKRIDK